MLAATDPANPYGATLPWPQREGERGAGARRRAARAPGAYLVTLDAEPVLYVEKGGKGLVAMRDPLEPQGGRGPAAWLAEALEALADAVRRGWIKRLAIERFDGDPVVGSALEAALVEAGFRQGPRKLTLSA